MWMAISIFNKAAIKSGFPSGDRSKQRLPRCFDDGEPIRTRTSIIGGGPDAPMPFAAAKTALLTLQKAGLQKAEVSSNSGNTTSRDFRSRHAAPDRPDDRMPLVEIEEHVSDLELEKEAVDVIDQLERDVTSEQLDFAKGQRYGEVAWKDMLPLNMSPIEGVAFLLACMEAQKNKVSMMQFLYPRDYCCS